MLSELLTKLDPSGALSSTSSMAAEDVDKLGFAHNVKNSNIKMDGGNFLSFS